MQSNTTLKSQTEQQKTTLRALEKANNEIMVLQKNVNEKDNLLENLAERLTQISKEYISLKANYASLHKVNRATDEVDTGSDNRTEPEDIIQTNVKETELELVKQSTLHKETQCEDTGLENKRKTSALQETINDLQKELENSQLEKEKFQTLSDELMEQNEDLTLKCETLTRGLRFTQEEHEKAIEELTNLKTGIDKLKEEHDDLMTVRLDCESTILALNADLMESNEERHQLKEKVNTLETYKQEALQQIQAAEINMTKRLKEVEVLKAESKELSDNLDSEKNTSARLAEEIDRLREDNVHYKLQVTNFEGKLSEMCAVSEENHSLRIQNDDLNNKINDQKDVIASLKTESSAAERDNANLIEQLEVFTVSVKSYENENTELMEEKQTMIQELSDLKSQVLAISDENSALKEKNSSLSVEIEAHKHKLEQELEVHEIAVTETVVQDHDTAMKPIEAVFIEPTIERQNMAANESVQRNSENPFANHDETNEEVTLEDAIHAQIINDNETGIGSSISEETAYIDSAGLLVTAPCVSNNDTAYESLQHTTSGSELGAISYEFNNSSSVKQTIECLHSEVNSAREALQEKTEECEKCHKEIQTLKLRQNLPTDIVTPNQTNVSSSDQDFAKADNVCKDSANEFQEVSDVPSASGAQEKEVNMHASSSPSCHINNVVALDSCSVGNVVTGDSSVVTIGDVHETGDTFQNLSETDTGPANEATDSAIDKDQMDGANRTLDTVQSVESERSESVAGAEQPETLTTLNEILRTQNTELTILIEYMKETEASLSNALRSEKQNNKKLSKNSENAAVSVSRLQSDLLEEQKNIERLNVELDNLASEHEKVIWERDEMLKRVSDLESENLEVKAAKCDMEFQKLEFLEELRRVNDRLEYLETCDNDVLEIKELVDSLQEERDAMKIENEKLQCSLSAHLEDNERLTETNHTLNKKNSVLLENLNRITGKKEAFESELEQVQCRKLELETEIESMVKSTEAEHVKSMGEIEGLLEENSTLKTNVQIKQTEIESLKNEVENMKSASVSMDKANEDVNILTTTNTELERKLQDMSKDNESLVSELMELQAKYLETVDEKEALLDKCDEYQNILNDLGNEKSELLEQLEQSKEQSDSTVQEHKAQIEKYEMQLESLDQENSTLKTMILQLEDDNKSMQENKETLDTFQTENLKCEVNKLESQKAELELQKTELEVLVSEKTADVETLTSQNNELCVENKIVAKQCNQHKQEVDELVQKEHYLNEQLKVYTEALNREKVRTANEDILSDQLELEKKYKAKLQSDVEKFHSDIDVLESKQRDLVDKLEKMESDKLKSMKLVEELENQLTEKCDDLCMVEAEHSSLKTEKQELKKELKAKSDEKAELQKELKETQNTVQFISANREHLRTQVEILAAEVENISESKDNIMLQYHEKDLMYRQLWCERDNLNETIVATEADLAVYIEENEQLKDEVILCEREMEKTLTENEKLKSDITKLNEQNQMLKKTIQTNKETLKMDEATIAENEKLCEKIQNLEDENEHLNEQNQMSKETIQTYQETLKIEGEMIAENEKLCEKNKNLEAENEILRVEIQDSHSNLVTLKDRVVKLTELMDEYKNRESDESISEQIEELNRKAAQVQKEKEQLQHLTEDMSNTLHDMQTKYEDVQSEMESKKKSCDKDIVDLRSQLKEMNEAVRELRKVLDYMESEMSNAAEEKISFLNKLEQQEKELTQLKDQKNKLEALLNVKQKKDLKNMKMVSEHHGASNTLEVVPNNDAALNISNVAQRREHNDNSNQDDEMLEEANAVVQLAEAITAMSESLSDLNETYELFDDNQDTDMESGIPSFEGAFDLFDLRSTEDTSNKFAQTNLTVGEFELSGFLLDDNGDQFENGKDTCLESVETQTDCSCIGTDPEKSLDTVLQMISRDAKAKDVPSESLENKIEKESHDQCIQTDFTEREGSYSSDKTVELNMDEEGIIHPEESEQMTLCEEITFPLMVCDSVQCELLTDSDDHNISCKKTNELIDSDIDNVDSVKHGIEEEDSLLPTFAGNLSMVSVDSGIMSAPVVLDDRNLYQFDGLEHGKGAIEARVKLRQEDTETDITESKGDLEVLAAFVDSEAQTEFDIDTMIDGKVMEIKEQLMIESDEKMAEQEAQIESKILKTLEYRETYIKQKEDNYERKIKNIEFEIEEKYEHRFREREVEIVIEAEKNKRVQCEEVERDAQRKIERVKKEKDQQFVETLQKVKADFERQKRYGKQKTRDVGGARFYDVGAVDDEHVIGLHDDGRSGLSENQVYILQVENQVCIR